MTYLLAIAIGPVQGFIAAARKTRDLWFGSNLLGLISLESAQKLERDGATLIFPAPRVVSRSEPVANKLLALVPDHPQARAAAARVAAQAVLSRYRAVSFRDGGNQGIDWDLVDGQLNAFIEWYAAWVPLAAKTYKDSREQVERLLAGRKALRNFPAAQGLAGRAKSSLDPALESVISNRGSLPAYWRVKPGEELDGVSLLKRAASSERFVSVSRIAVDPFIRQLAGHEALTRLNDGAARLASTAVAERFPVGPGSELAHYAAFPYDCELFYDDGSREKDLTDGQRETARAFYRTVNDVAKQVGSTPPAYFAVLAADGDRMGATLSSMTTTEQHQAFSEALAHFAALARRIVTANFGALVYCGGDDVLAFLPLDTAFCCADELRRAFERIVSDVTATTTTSTSTSTSTSRNESVTMSVGLSFGHYGEHLDTLLQWARDAEHAAKERGGRNALAVAFHSRTGGEAAIEAIHSWQENPVVERWWPWVQAHRADEVPDGAAYELRSLAAELRGMFDHGAASGTGVERVIVAEVERVLKRKRRGHGTEDVEASLIGSITTRMTMASDTGADVWERARQQIRELDRIVSELLIARRLADVMAAPCDPSRLAQLLKNAEQTAHG